MGKLDGQVAIVTGASSGIGEAIAVALAKEGADVVITGRNRERLAETGEACKKAGGQVLEVVVDVNDVDALELLINDTVKKFGRIDILVNNAGYGVQGYIENLALEVYEEIFQTNLRAPVFLCKYALPHLKKTKGCVVNISSVAGTRATAKFVTKAALDHFTRGFAAECAQAGIRVNSVNPAAVNTRFGERLGLDSETLRKIAEHYQTAQPLGIIDPKTVADSVLFLCLSTHTTGITLVIDGELTGGLDLPSNEIQLQGCLRVVHLPRKCKYNPETQCYNGGTVMNICGAK